VSGVGCQVGRYAGVGFRVSGGKDAGCSMLDEEEDYCDLALIEVGFLMIYSFGMGLSC